MIYASATELKPIKVETFVNFKRKIRLMFFSMPLFLYFVFMTILNSMGEQNRFIHLLNKFYIPFTLGLFGFLAYAAYLHFFKRFTVKIRKTFKGEFHIIIEDGKGKDIQNSGNWTMLGQYVKTHYKLGTYQKQLNLTLFCNGKEFAIFFYHSSATYQVPVGFQETDQPVLLNVPRFITPEVETIYRYLKSQ